MGGIRLGLEEACRSYNLDCQCVLTSEIKESAIKAYTNNFSDDHLVGDVTLLDVKDIPDFDFLLAGFPCQPFSSAGTRQGFQDTRGTLFFEIERILKTKQPYGFLLENVEGLVNHDKGQTLATIINSLKNLGYKVNWKVLNSKDFGVPQDRKRIFIVGTTDTDIPLDSFEVKKSILSNILESDLPLLETTFTKTLLKHYKAKELEGKAIKDKRGGADNIHSWDIELKGKVSKAQKQVLEMILRVRRQKKWAEQKGIAWMDGMPLTLDEIQTFYNPPNVNLKEILDDLVEKGYLRFEHPKDLYEVDGRKVRQYATDKAKGYNIVVGKLSFEISKILDSNGISPTLVATDVNKLAVVDGLGIRNLSIREGLRLCGFPDWYELNLPSAKAYDLLGNTVVVPVVEEIAQRLVAAISAKPIPIAIDTTNTQQPLFSTT